MEVSEVADFFLAELHNNESRKSQLLALDHLPFVHKLLSSEEFAQKIQPALVSLAKNSDPFVGEEVLRRLAERVSEISSCREEILVSLAQHVDEPAVREVVIGKLSEIYASREDKISLINKFSAVPLSGDVWAFGTRATLAQLVGRSKIFSEEISERIRREISALLQDESPMIRRLAARSLVSVVSRAKNFVPEISDLLADLRRLAADPDEELRMHAVHACTEIRKNFRSSDVVLPVVARLLTDSSAKIRRRVLDLWRLEEGAVWEPAVAISDPDAEVRRLAVEAVSADSILARDSTLFASLAQMATGDRDVGVRCAALEKLADVYGRIGIEDPEISAKRKSEVEEAMRKGLTETGPGGMFMVRISSVRGVLKMDGEGSLLVNEVAGLLNDGNWRVREFVVSNFARLVAKDKSIISLYPAAFTDTVSAVRELAVDKIEALNEVAGGTEWLQNSLVPKIKELFNPTHAFYHRLIAVRAVGVVARLLGVDSEEFKTTGLLETVLSPALKDPVQNVQISCRKLIDNFPELATLVQE